MKRIHKRHLKTISIIWACSGLMLVLGYMTVLGPHGKLCRNVGRELTQKEREYNDALEASQQRIKDRLAEELEQVQQRVGDFVVPFEESTDVTFDIGRIVDQLGIESFNIQNRGSEKKRDAETKYVDENQMGIGFEANFGQFASFLNSIERHRPVLFVERFNIDTPERKGGKPRVSMDLVYLVKKPEKE